MTFKYVHQLIQNDVYKKANGVYVMIFSRSETSGNCLYSSVSLALVGNNSLSNILRVLTSIELFCNAEFYYNHPCLQNVFKDHNKLFLSYNSLICMIVSHEALDTGCISTNLIRKQAIFNCESLNRWASFIHFLSLSSVIGRTIHTYYPDFRLEKWKVLFSNPYFLVAVL